MSVTFSEVCSYGPGGRGASIGYSIIDSMLGRLLVAGTRHGLCFAALGDSDRAIISELRADYPKASIQLDDGLAGNRARAISKNISARLDTTLSHLELNSAT